LLPGWVPTSPAAEPGQPVEVAELGQWLRGQADAIADRVRHLGEQAAEHTPAWTAHLGPVPADPLEADAWIAAAGQVAAYRERFGVADDHPDLLPGGEQGEAARARAWVQHHLATPATEPAEHTGNAEEQQRQPGRTDLSPEATWERMARWRADHDRAYGADQQQPVQPDLDQVRRRYNELTIAMLHARTGDDTAREQAARAALEKFTTRHREQVETFQQEARQVLDRLSSRGAGSDREQTRHAMEQAWRERPHSQLTGRELDRALAQQRDRAERAAQGQAAAAARLTELQPQVAAGHGPHVQAVDARVTELAARAALAAEHEKLARQYQAARTEMGVSAAQATGKDFDAERVTRWDAIRHPGLRDRLTAEAADLSAQAARAEHIGGVLLGRMRELTEQAGGDQELRRAPFEARVAADHHEPDRHAAQAADQRDVDHLRQQVDKLGTTAERASTTAGELAEEQQVRSAMPIDQKALETRLRSASRTEQRAQETERQQAQQHRALDHERAYEPPHLDQHIDRGPGLSL
jgi:hypothetical protein